MLSIKEFNKKIGSLKNTRKMTKTMKMVSASKFKRAHKAQQSSSAYANKLQELMARLSANAMDSEHPLFKQQKVVRNILIVLFTSDKGLCGGFNNNLVRYIKIWLNEQGSRFASISFAFCGRRGYNSLRRQVSVMRYVEGITAKPDFAQATVLAKEMMEKFTMREFDEVYLAYNRFQGPLSQTPTLERVLPLDVSVLNPSKIKTTTHDYEYEPHAVVLLSHLVDRYFKFKLFYTLLENAAGEHGARMTAMDKASQNTADLIDRYTLLRNRARQAAITTELIEIISGAEALK